MNKLTDSMGYISPEATFIDVMPMSILCQSGEGGSSYDVTLEDMTENDYTFTF